MSIFNNNDFDNDTNITKDELDKKLLGYFNKVEEVRVDYGLNLNSNIYVDSDTINKEKIIYVKNVSSDIQTQITTLQNNIGGVYSGDNNYSGDNIYIGQSQFNQITLNNNGISTQLNSRELSYLDGTTSNIQSQLNYKQNLISNAITNNLVSMDNLGQTINNNVSITNDENLNITSNNLIPSTTAIKNYVDNKINNLSYESTVGQPILFYFSNTSNNISGYEDLLNKPDTLPEDIEVITINNNRVLLHGYSSIPLNRTLIPAGIWSFTFYGYVNDNTSLTRYEVEIYKRDNNDVETLIETILSNDINLSSVGVINFNGTVQNDTVINLTDRLIIKIYGFSNVSNKTISLYFYHSGSNHNSYFSSPLVLNHNDLSGLNSGDYQHLSLIQKQKATQYSNITQDGILSQNDFITFNNKQNNIIATTTSDYFRGDKTFQPLTKDTINLNNVDNTSDINKPISNSTQLALNNKQNIINNTVDLVCNSISDITGNLRDELNLMNTFYQLIYVAGQFGNNNNSGYSVLKPKLTIQNAIDNGASNTGVIIKIMPWVYTETPITINKQNITISAMTYDRSALVSINTLNITSIASSVRLIGISIDILNISGNCNVYLNCCKINQINKSGNGYMEITDCNINQSIYLNCIGSMINIFASNMPCVITNSNTATNNTLNISNNLLIGPISIIGNSNIVAINNTPNYSVSSANYAININGTANFLYLTNTTILNPDNSNGKIFISVNNYYSILNVVYNKSSSVFNGSKISRIMYNNNISSDIVNSESLNFTGNLNSTSAIQLTYLNNVTSDIQEQLNNCSILNGNNAYTGTNIFYNNLTISAASLILYNGSIISFLDNNNNNVYISTTNLNCLDGLTDNVQTSIDYIINSLNNINNNKIDVNNNTTNNFNGINNFNIASTLNLNGVINLSTSINANLSQITPTEISYLDGLTDNIQNQINNISTANWNEYIPSNGIYIYASGVSPTPATNLLKLNYSYLKNGKQLIIKFLYGTIDRSGATNGSGYYFIKLPIINGTQIMLDNNLYMYSSSSSSNNGYDTNYGSFLGPVAYTNSANWSFCNAFARNNTDIYFATSNKGTTNGGVISSSYGELSTIYRLEFTITLFTFN